MEHNKDDNNEDSINLTIGEDDIKLFADEVNTYLISLNYYIINKILKQIFQMYIIS